VRLAMVFRWTARVWSLLSLAFVLAFLIGDALSGSDQSVPLSWTDAVGVALFPTGVLAGMALGWWREVAGGILGLCSLAAFYLFLTIVSGRVPGGPYFALFAAPAALFLIAGLLTRSEHPSDGTRTRRSTS